MAKLQRWRRTDAGEEGTGPETDPDTTDVDVPEEPDEPADSEEEPPAEESGAEATDEVAEESEESEEPEESAAAGTSYDGPVGPAATPPARSPWRDSTTLCLVRAAHPKQGGAIALAVLTVAVLADRPAREAGVIFAAVLTGQAILGWHNDLVDRARDRAHEATGKPVADGRLSVANTWFALALAALLLVPLSITTGITAGLIYLASVGLGMLGNVLFRTTPLSWWSWAASFALLPAYVSYGGWGGQAVGDPPETVITVLAALAGIGVHLISSVWGLVADHRDGWDTLPLKLGLRLGATRLLVVSSAYLVAVVVAMAIVGAQVGLSR